MSFQSPFLHKVNTVDEAPSETFILYSLHGGIFWIDRKDYEDFVLQWIGLSNPPPLAIDLSSTNYHSIVLDFDFKFQSSYTLKSICELIESILKTTFLPSVPNFTYIIACRRGGKGIHIHLPEFKIGSDDYILFCESLQYKFKQAMCGNESYVLDILTNSMLPGSAKPNCNPYEPTAIVYVDERKTSILNFININNHEIEILRKSFKSRKDNEKSIFRDLLNSTPSLILVKIKRYMLPVIQNQRYTLLYGTTISKNPNVSPDWQDVAKFFSKRTNEIHYISKCNNLTFNSPNLLKAYHYIKLNSKNIKNFETNNHALKQWFKRFNHENASNFQQTPQLFWELYETLQFEHASLSEDPNPLKTIMQFNDGYYFLPVFYTLCQHYKMDSQTMAKNLYLVLDKQFHELLHKIQSVDPKNIEYAITDMTINTLHFCANNLYKKRHKTYQEKLKSIVQNNKRSILSVSKHDQMVECIRNIQDRHLPIRVLRLKHALKRPIRYIWNALSESWQEVQLSGELCDHVNNLWGNIKQFLNEYRESGGLGGPDEELIQKFSVGNVVSNIMSDTSMERKDIHMDAHKWFLRLEDGVLDLLTGHVGGVVPEFFLSEREMKIGIPRQEMILLCNKSPKHYDLYEKLTDKKFFLKYLQNLFLDTTESLFDTLRHLLDEDSEDDEVSKSMQHFYINLCKYTSFEYDMLMYMLDILASVFIATNYERKFFVWKGLTRNGKSKLFELMGRVLGGYYYSIKSENLAPGHSLNIANPELACTLFSCRMISSEELEKKIDENRVKQITGNSFVAFRNMYEQNAGGIPTAKLFASTNNYPECKASEAFKDRVVAIPFDAEFTDNAPKLTSQQVGTNTYAKEPYIVEQSYKGCFFMLYYHLRKFINLKDGLLHYREEPEYIVEYTNDYLIHADIYVQFKLFMDVQLMSGSMTTMNDVKSAVRQYLKTTKNTSYHESDLFISFEKEFGHLRRTDIGLNSESFDYTSVLEEDEPSPKKQKTDDSLVVYYEGVVIKNLKRTNLDN